MEKITFGKQISTQSAPECWLKEVEAGMKQSLYELLPGAVHDFSIKESEGKLGDWIVCWPGQIMVLALKVIHCNNMEKMFG